jgi:ion channel-forming bestrophin family protein
VITYNPKDWFTFIFKIHRTETFRQLIPLMIGVSVYAFFISYFELHYIIEKEAAEITKNISVIYSLLGFTLSLLLVFRTNSAYDRWWEGRKQWGELTNISRSLAAHFSALLGAENKHHRAVLANYIGMYAYALQAHLKTEKISQADIKSRFSVDEIGEENIQKIVATYHQPQEIFKQLVAYTQTLRQQDYYSVHDMYLFKAELNKLIDVCGACERIKNTPIPFSYSVFLKKFIFFYVMLFPLVYGINMSYFIIPVTVFILYVLASIELIGEEIEDPFNGEPNDLPTAGIAENIKKSVMTVLAEQL